MLFTRTNVKKNERDGGLGGHDGVPRDTPHDPEDNTPQTLTLEEGSTVSRDVDVQDGMT